MCYSTMNHWTAPSPQSSETSNSIQSGFLCINIWNHKIRVWNSCKDWGCTKCTIYTHSETGDRRALPVGLGTPTTLTRNWARSCSRATTWWGTLMNSGGEPFSSEISEIIHPETFRHVYMTSLRWGWGGEGNCGHTQLVCSENLFYHTFQ